VKEDKYRDEAVKLLKLQKHDMVNYLQVALSYIQLNKSQEAEKYLKYAMLELQRNESILNIVYPKLVISLLLKIYTTFKSAIPLTVNCKSNLENTCIDEYLLTEFLEKVWDEIIASQLKSTQEKRSIDFIIDSDDSFIFVSNNLKVHIEAETINELDILFSKIGYEVICSDDILKISKK